MSYTKHNYQVGGIIYASDFNEMDDQIAANESSCDALKSATANTFSASQTYAVGDYVFYNGVLYRFKTTHSAGAWNSAHVDVAVLANDVESRTVSYNVVQSKTDTEKKTARSNTTSVGQLDIASQFSTSTAYKIGQYVFYNSDLYRFKTAHSAGAWNSSHVDRVSLADYVRLSDVKQRLLADDVPDTTQYYTFSGGSVSQVQHRSGQNVLRTDAFTYGTSSITEARTLDTGESLTIVTNLNTLETQVTFTAA